MKVRLAPELVKKLKKQDVRIRKNLKIAIDLFSINPQDSRLDNHELQREWEGFSSIDITSDWRAIFEYKKVGDEIVAYFVALGTHEELYQEP
ncbi:type II toxin-antitoxin system mRNA interferase toxin, RelE/StbE family [Candidatus Gottesmanbacteria bacterium]|nr:type II toxin-antitoxin system mRNA interferase toxin, RelE/StbE family [Candidatus Gottesmanbacteria bacterium]